MKKNMILTVIVLAAAVFAGLVLAFLDEAKAPHASNSAQSVAFQESLAESVLPVADSSPPPELPPEPPEPPEPSSASAEAKPQGWLLGEHEGWLAVFPAGSESPSMIYDVLVRALPAYDREQLANGIYAQNEAQLEQLLEDYIS